MTSPKRRATLHIAKPEDAPKGPPLALVKKALRLFRGRNVPKAVAHANARKWLAANAMLGENHLLRGHVLKGNVLKGASATWGQPGDMFVDQVMAPRRLGGK